VRRAGLGATASRLRHGQRVAVQVRNRLVQAYSDIMNMQV
jgi:Flagellar hook-basal body complex protein FliE